MPTDSKRAERASSNPGPCLGPPPQLDDGPASITGASSAFYGHVIGADLGSGVRRETWGIEDWSGWADATQVKLHYVVGDDPYDGKLDELSAYAIFEFEYEALPTPAQVAALPSTPSETQREVWDVYTDIGGEQVHSGSMYRERRVKSGIHAWTEYWVLKPDYILPNGTAKTVLQKLSGTQPRHKDWLSAWVTAAGSPPPSGWQYVPIGEYEWQGPMSP